MSSYVQGLVWVHFKEKGNKKLLALALADHCGDDEGTAIFPSVKRLAERILVDRRTVQRLLRELEDSTWLQRVNESPTEREGRRTVRYRINPEFMRLPPEFPPRKKGGNLSHGGAAICRPEGGIAMPPELKGTREKPLRDSTAKTCPSCGERGTVGFAGKWYCRLHDPVAIETGLNAR